MLAFICTYTYKIFKHTLGAGPTNAPVRLFFFCSLLISGQMCSQCCAGLLVNLTLPPHATLYSEITLPFTSLLSVLAVALTKKKT